MRRILIVRSLLWLGLLGLMLLAGRSIQRGYESMLVLADVGAGAAPSRLKQVTASPSRTAVTYTVKGRRRDADLYLPAAEAPQAAIVLVPGVVPQGKDDTRLVQFARTLARARFAVFVPALAGFRELRIRPADVREVADAFAYLAGRPDLAPAGRAGIGGFSYGLGPAVLAALEPEICEQVRFILGVGGYYNLPRSVAYFTTGWFQHDGQWHYLSPNDYGKLVFAKSSQPYLPARDRAILERMVTIRLEDRTADLSPLASGLSPPGTAVYALLTNTDPLRVPQHLAALPAQLRDDIAALSLHNKDLSALKARLILVHGKNDNLIPYPESLALAAAVPPGRARLFVIERLLDHVDLRPAHLFSWQFISQELPDAWRLWRAVDALLSERERARHEPAVQVCGCC